MRFGLGGVTLCMRGGSSRHPPEAARAARAQPGRAGRKGTCWHMSWSTSMSRTGYRVLGARGRLCNQPLPLHKSVGPAGSRHRVKT